MTLGRQFAEALAAKDFDGLRSSLHPEIDFAGLTPRRAWAADDPTKVIQEVLRLWFEDSDQVEEVLSWSSRPTCPSGTGASTGCA